MTHPVTRRSFLKTAAAAGAGASLPVWSFSFVRAAPRFAGFDRFATEAMHEARVPGLAAVAVRGEELLLARGYGWANIAKKVPAEADTPFMLASISKTVTCAALMQVVQAGKCDLDADVNDYLSFEVRNPHHQDVPITPRMLLAHISSIKDRDSVWHGLYADGDSPIGLGTFLESYLASGGERYDPKDYYDYAPGKKYNYSNIGAALAGYLVTAITGTQFDDHCDKEIFRPLDMTNTGWHLADFPDPELVAMPYRYRYDSGRYEAFGQYGYPDYPDGQLRSSVESLSKWLRAFMNFGALDGARVLEDATVAEIRADQAKGITSWVQGLIWYFHHHQGSHPYRLLGHNGGDKGVSTQMFFRPDANVGAIVLSNSGAWNRTRWRALSSVRDRLIHEMYPST